MKMKTKYFLFLMILLSTLACTKLDEKLTDKIPGSIYPETPDQVANLSVDAYGMLQPFADDNGWWFLAQEISSDELCGPTRGADWYDGGKWLNMYRHTWTNNDEGVNRMWDSFWAAVTRCNLILEKMSKLPQNAALTSKIKEVEAMRDYFYYMLIDNYGDTPYLTTATGAPEKPFKLKRAAVFDSITTNLKQALPYLKPIDRKYMMTRYTAYALLTKLYLNAKVYTGTEHWADAEYYCDSVLAGPYVFGADVLAPFKTNNDNNPEIIFSIPYDENTFTGFRLHMRTLHYQMNLKFDMPVGPWNGFAIVPTFLDTYDTNDIRRSAYNIYGPQYDTKGNQIIEGQTHLPLNVDPHLAGLYMQAPAFNPTQIRTSGARVGKYEIKLGAKENLSNDLPLFRITDFMLIKAELLIRQGKSGADDLINQIRQRAHVTPWSNATLEQLLAERGRELYCEGVRRQDLIRFGVWENPWWEKLAHGKDRETFPIPKYATDLNPNLLLPAK